MPYIKQKDRKQYKHSLDNLCATLEQRGYIDGHVTYVLFMILARWWFHSPAYKSIASIRGCLVGTLSELDRKYFHPYEDKKIRENGDVDVTLQWVEKGKLSYHVCPCCVDGLRGD